MARAREHQYPLLSFDLFEVHEECFCHHLDTGNHVGSGPSTDGAGTSSAGNSGTGNSGAYY
jgi:hypothetical protein